MHRGLLADRSTNNTMLPAVTKWTDRIAVEEIGGVPFRMYTKRPHRAEQLLALADQYDERPHIIHGDRVVSFSGLQRGSAQKAITLRR